MPERIYLDHNATTPLRPEVARLLTLAIEREVIEAGNPSSVHGPGREARARLSQARRGIAETLGADPREVFFTSSGTEATLWALRGAFLARSDTRRRRIVTSAIEHPGLLLALAQLEKELGAEVVRVPPEPDGRVDAERIAQALGEDTVVCSLQWANNETGVLQPVDTLSSICRARGTLFHTDAVQAAGKVSLDLARVPADLVSLSAHKLGGPAGVGALVSRTPLAPLIPGHQEGGQRGGTPNVAACEAFALALSLAQTEVVREGPRLAALRDELENDVRRLAPGTRVQGTAPRMPNTTNLGFPGVDAETLLIALDLEGFALSTGAACASGSLEPSHVLLAMGSSAEEARESIRVSLGHGSKAEHVQAFVKALAVQLPRAARG